MKTIVILFLVVTTISCEKTDQPREIRFRDIGFSLQLPSQWQQLDEEKIDQAQKQVEDLEQISIYGATIVSSYAGKKQSSLIISSLSSATSESNDGTDLPSRIETYVADIERYFQPDFSVTIEKSSVDGFDAVFLQMYNDDVFAVKTVYYGSNDTVFQIDFLIPRGNLTEELLKEVETALLSVKKL
jgi:hypothetical protein